MNYKCQVCRHENRTDIESALLAGATILTLHDQYPELKPAEIKRHMLNCAPYVTSLDEFDKEVQEELNRRRQEDPTNENLNENYLRLAYTSQSSIQRQLKLKEADHLAASAQEYLLTLKNLGRKINRVIDIMDTPEGATLAARTLRKPVCDMYVQVGAEIRQTVETLAKLDNLLHGADENPLTGLQALATAINASQSSNAQTVQTNARESEAHSCGADCLCQPGEAVSEPEPEVRRATGRLGPCRQCGAGTGQECWC